MFFYYDKLTPRNNDEEHTAVSTGNASLLSKLGLCTRLTFFKVSITMGQRDLRRKATKENRKPKHRNPS